MQVILRIAAQNLRQGGRRVVMLAAALAIATCLLVLVVSQFAAANSHLVAAGTALQSGDLNVGGAYRSSPTRMSPLVIDAAEAEAKIRAILPPGTGIVTRHTGQVRLVSESGMWRTYAWGVNIANEPRLAHLLDQNLVAHATGPTGAAADLSLPRSVVLFESQATRLKARVGDKLTAWARSPQGRTNALDVTVRAIAWDLGALTSWTILLDAATLAELVQAPPASTAQLLVYLDDRRQVAASMVQLRDGLTRGGTELMPYRNQPSYTILEAAETEDWRGQRLFVNTWSDELADFTWRIAANAGIAALLFFVLVVIITIGVTNSMFVAVQQRTREIGTLRSLGMSRSQLVATFVTEGILLGLCSAGVGGLVGAALAIGLDAQGIAVESAAFRDVYFTDTLGFTVDPYQVAAVVGIFALAAGSSAVWPALRAARQDPAAALRNNG